MPRMIVFLSLCLLACTDSTQVTEPTDSSSSGGDGASAVCEPGADQTCNDNPAISSLHGRCLPNGTCECVDGIEKSPDSGRCL